MSEDFYQKISKPFRENSSLLKILLICNVICTLVGYAAYPGLILLCLWKRELNTIYYVLIPATVFIAVSIFRNIVNAKRPYEVFQREPLIKKEKAGHSFPSRHVLSIFIIAGCFFGISVPIGIIICICGILLAIIRVAGGVHFVRDVVWGTAIGFISGVAAALCYLFL